MISWAFPALLIPQRWGTMVIKAKALPVTLAVQDSWLDALLPKPFVSISWTKENSTWAPDPSSHSCFFIVPLNSIIGVHMDEQPGVTCLRVWTYCHRSHEVTSKVNRWLPLYPVEGSLQPMLHYTCSWCCFRCSSDSTGYNTSLEVVFSNWSFKCRLWAVPPFLHCRSQSLSSVGSQKRSQRSPVCLPICQSVHHPSQLLFWWLSCDSIANMQHHCCIQPHRQVSGTFCCPKPGFYPLSEALSSLKTAICQGSFSKQHHWICPVAQGTFLHNSRESQDVLTIVVSALCIFICANCHFNYWGLC